MDLRSDTVTKPTTEMLEAMMQAAVGDDVLEEDPTVRLLEEKVAALFGKDAGIFCPSGTMTNQIAIRINTNPQDQVICDKRSHVYLYEGGGMASNCLVSVKLLDGDRGRITAADVLQSINPVDIHCPITRLVVLENTVNMGGGSCYALSEVKKIRQVTAAHQLKLHLDGARFFNALAVTKENPVQWGQQFDTISLCLSKGLGAPVGSVLVSDQQSILKAKRVRKVFGGGMRQAGYLAAAGLYALENHIDKLAEDNRRASELGEILNDRPFVKLVHPVDTNIILFELQDHIDPEEFIEKLESYGIKALSLGGRQIRMVTHLEITDNMVDQFSQVIKKFG